MKARWMILKDGLYGCSHILWIGPADPKRMAALVRRYGLASEPFEIGMPDADTAMLTSRFARGCLVWLPHFPSTALDHSNLCHEIFHVAAHVLGFRGLALDDSSEEAYAYYIGWLTRAILNRLWAKATPSRT